MPAAALIAFVSLHTWLRRPALQAVLSAAAALLTVASYTQVVHGYRVVPTLFADARTRALDEAHLRAEADWLWPMAAARYRDATLKPGDVIAYDSGTSFLGEYWTADLRNRVAYVEDEGDDGAYLARLQALHPVWVSVQGGSRGEAVLRAHPDVFQPLFAVPRSGARMYRVVAPLGG